MVTQAPNRPQSLLVPPFREFVPDGNGGWKMQLNMHPGQADVWNAEERIIAAISGTRGGKTEMGPPWLHREMTNVRDIVGPGKPIGDFFAVTSTFELFDAAVRPACQSYFETPPQLVAAEDGPESVTGGLGIAKYHPGRKIFQLRENLEPDGALWADNVDEPMYGRLVLRSADALTGLDAWDVKAAWLDEAGQPKFTREAYEAVMRRLGIWMGRALITTTPYNMDWLLEDVYVPWQKGNPDYRVAQWDSTANPAFPKEEYEAARKRLPGWKFAMFYQGLFARPAGLIYDVFRQAQCIINPLARIPSDWLWWVGHDFGQNNPAAVILVQDPGTGIFYLVHEYLPGSKPVADQVRDLKALTEGRNVIYRAGGAHHEDGWRQLYAEHGWPIDEPAITDVELGIDNCYALMARNALFVFNENDRTIGEITTYSRKVDPRDGQTVLKDIENKSRFHLMDALRGILSFVSADRAVDTELSQIFEGSW